MFRAMQGIAVALCLPTSVGILTNAVESGKRRNVGFACMGLGQPLGFSAGARAGRRVCRHGRLEGWVVHLCRNDPAASFCWGVEYTSGLAGAAAELEEVENPD